MDQEAIRSGQQHRIDQAKNERSRQQLDGLINLNYTRPRLSAGGHQDDGSAHSGDDSLGKVGLFRDADAKLLRDWKADQFGKRDGEKHCLGFSFAYEVMMGDLPLEDVALHPSPKHNSVKDDSGQHTHHYCSPIPSLELYRNN